MLPKKNPIDLSSPRSGRIKCWCAPPARATQVATLTPPARATQVLTPPAPATQVLTPTPPAQATPDPTPTPMTQATPVPTLTPAAPAPATLALSSQEPEQEPTLLILLGYLFVCVSLYVMWRDEIRRHYPRM